MQKTKKTLITYNHNSRTIRITCDPRILEFWNVGKDSSEINASTANQEAENREHTTTTFNRN